MTSIAQTMVSRARPFARSMARILIGKIPPPASRLGGALARYGGVPVRDIRFRPWASMSQGNSADWWMGAGAQLKRVFSGGIEGLPQPLAKQFAQAWAAECRCRFGLLLPHGTDALRIALASVLDHDGLEYGGEIVVPNFSFIASATAALDRRFGVVLVDVDPQTLLLDPERVREAIVPGRTRAIMPVHLFGQPANMSALCGIAEEYGLKVVEDAAQAHTAAWRGKPVGSIGHAGAFSFQSSKNLMSGEGGALTTNDPAIYERAWCMHNAGRAFRNPGRWEHVSLGWNIRPTEYQAAVLLFRLKSLHRRQKRRSANFELLRRAMRDIKSLVPVATASGVTSHGMHMFVVRYRKEICRGLPIEEFLTCLQAEGLPIYRSFVTTISDQPAIKALAVKRPDYIRALPSPVANEATEDVLYIPHEVFLGSADDMTELAEAMHKVERHFSGGGM